MSIFDQGSSDTGCIGVCSTLFDAVCKGCGRTAYEVDNWVFLTDEEKEAARKRSKAFKEGAKPIDPVCDCGAEVETPHAETCPVTEAVRKAFLESGEDATGE